MGIIFFTRISENDKEKIRKNQCFEKEKVNFANIRIYSKVNNTAKQARRMSTEKVPLYCQLEHFEKVVSLNSTDRDILQATETRGILLEIRHDIKLFK